MRARLWTIMGCLLISAFCILALNTAEAAASKYVRWSKSSMPLKVYIPQSSTVTGFKKTYPVDVARALKQWNTDTKGFVTFVSVNDPKKADIVIEWKNKMNKAEYIDSAKGHSYVWGVTQIGNPTKIKLVTSHPLNDNHSLSDNVVYMISLHEIGHALGVWWHTSDPKDIMYPDFVVPSTASGGSKLIANQNRGTLSRRDIQNLVSLYNKNDVKLLNKVARNTTIQMPSFNNTVIGSVETTGSAAATVKAANIKSDVDYGQALATLKKNPDSYEAHNNIGLVYLKGNDYDNAIKMFTKAISLNPTYANGYFNLGLAYEKTNNSPMAIKQYQKYLELSPKSANAGQVQQEINRLKGISMGF